MSLLIHLLCLFFINVLYTENILAKPLELSEAIKIALASHPSIGVADATFKAENLSITPLYFPENPTIGIMSENNIKSWTVSQEISFPSKYYYKGLIQKQRSLFFKEDVIIKKLQLRSRVISTYYEFFQREKTLELLKMQRDLLKEIARIAESLRIVGKTSVQDEMRAHLEQAKIENEILIAEQDLTKSKAKIKELLENTDGTERTESAEGDTEKIQLSPLEKPKLNVTIKQLRDLIQSLSLSKSEISGLAPSLKLIYQQLLEADAQKKLANSNYWPDLEFSYQKSLEKDNDDKTIFIGFKIPLWFLGKENNDSNAASARVVAAQKNLETSKRELQSTLRSLLAKIEASENILNLYSSTLIPQGVSIINSSRSAYKAGRIGFLEILDSERTVYQLKTTYYQELKEYAETIAEIESNLGQSISSISFEGVL